jgi:hypothetical protein
MLDANRLQILTVSNEFEHVSLHKKGWRIPVTRKLGHAYLVWRPQAVIAYSRSQLEKLRKHLYHPGTEKVINLLRRATLEDVTAETRALLDDIAKHCHACQVYSSAPIRFSLRTPDHVVFNQELRLDLMFVGARVPVLHVVDAGMTFQAATFLAGEDASSVWNGFLKCWPTAFVGHPASLLTDQGSVFVSELFTSACTVNEIELRHTGTESHSSLGSGERYHAPLRQVYNKIRMENPCVPIDVCLQAAVYAINSTASPEGLVPSLLVFGILPKLPSIPGQCFPNRERMRINEVARKEYEVIVAKQRIHLGLNKKPPPASDHVYAVGDSVYVFRERLKSWTGPHVVASVDDKDIAVYREEKSGPRHFNVWQVKPSLLSAPVVFENSICAARERSEYYIHWTEVLESSDPRATRNKMSAAKHDEIVGLINRGTFKLAIIPVDQQKGVNVVPTKFVLSIRHMEGC